MHQSPCPVDWCIAFKEDSPIRAWDNAHRVLHRQLPSRFLPCFKWSSWFASVVKQATYGHCQATSGQILKVYFLYLRLFVCNKSAEIIAIICLLIDAYTRRILLQMNNVICCCMISLEIVVDLWIEYPFSPFLRQCIALFEQLKIVKFMNLFPNSTRE